MAKYILKASRYIIVVFFLLSLLLFGIFKMVPGDPARLMVEGQKMQRFTGTIRDVISTSERTFGIG